ncbi:hypothetical protein GOP47_0019200 [Adiantum capillus-veneris]|uniref:Uncharacterized protein n=1 Tax=Adiantum capillus-veneris TaxID=13818 RepID=A0A9D4UEP6_ADICA|nr:hypothetical protein GOP47_0019200 [Adiantum capillus-veneris]
MDDEEFLSSLSPQQRQWYVERHRSGASSRVPTPSASPSISEHSACSEALSSTRRASHSSRHRRSSGGGGSCCGDSATDASTPPRVRRGSLPSPSLPAPTPATASPSTPPFARLTVPSSYTPLPTPPGATPLDTPRFGAQTPVETPDVRTPIDTPIETPAGTPRFTRHRPEGLPYSVNFSGGIIMDDDGKKVISRMRGLCSQLFRHYILNKWSEVPSDLKNRVISILHDEFSVPTRDQRFNEDLMKIRMREYCKHKRSEVQKAIKHGWNRPDWLAKEDWKNAKKAARENPDKWKQQKDAARARVKAGSSHHLGSGGWASFQADFWSMTGRDPTPYEREYAGKKGLNALMDILSSRGGMNLTDTPLGRDETSN